MTDVMVVITKDSFDMRGDAAVLVFWSSFGKRKEGCDIFAGTSPAFY